MRTFRAIPDKDVRRYVDIVVDAYPGLKLNTTEDRNRMEERIRNSLLHDKRQSLHGIYENQQLVAGMRYHRFQMNLFGQLFSCGGAGLVAVDFSHKKRGLAKDLMREYLRYFYQKGTPLAALYPFRPDFYRKMGFGYGGKTRVYNLKPANFPSGKGEHVRLLGKSDMTMLARFYADFCRQVNGMILETADTLALQLELWPMLRVAGFVEGKKVRGCMRFRFESAHQNNLMHNDLRIIDLAYDDREVLRELCAFIHNQADQINRIHFQTADDTFYFMFDEFRHESNNVIPLLIHQSETAGVGIMYRIINTRLLLEQLSSWKFGTESFVLGLHVTDSFLEENAGPIIVRLTKGRPKILQRGKTDFEVTLNIDDFSSMFFGAVDAKSLHTYGRLEISKERFLDSLTDAFRCPARPQCFTFF